MNLFYLKSDKYLSCNHNTNEISKLEDNIINLISAIKEEDKFYNQKVLFYVTGVFIGMNVNIKELIIL